MALEAPREGLDDLLAVQAQPARPAQGQFELLAVAINTGTNLPSVATPNGQAAFLFLLTSALAPLIRLSYGRMVWMALPYTLVLTLVGLLCVEFTLMPVTEWLLAHGWLVTPTLP